MVTRTLAALLAAPLLAGCGGPVFVPEAGPGSRGYVEKSAPPPPRVHVVRAAPREPLPSGGVIDGVVRKEGAFEVTGWAVLDADPPRGVLQMILPTGSAADVQEVVTVPRPDVADATGSDALLWAGFTITVRGTLPQRAGVCVLSQSKQGAFRLSGSDEGLCPA